MRLKKKSVKKQALALAIAATVAVSVPVSANAQVSYKAEEGTVHVSQDGDDVKSYQSKESGDTDKVTDSDIEIKGDGDDNTTESQGKIVEVDDNVKDAKITIDGVDNETKNGESAIDIGKGADVDLTIKETDITLDDTSKGIDIAGGDTEDTKTTVDITAEGNNTITGGDTGVDISGDAEVTIKDDETKGGSLTIENADTGIFIGKGSKLNIEDGVEVNIHHKDDDDDEKKEKKPVGIQNEGELNVSGEGTSVNIVGELIGILAKGDDNSDSNNGDVNVSEQANVTVEDTDTAVKLSDGAELNVDDNTGAELNTEALAAAEGETVKVNDGCAKVASTNIEYDSLKNAISDAKENDTIYLGEGSYSTYGNPKTTKSLTFIGQKDTLGKELTKWYIGAAVPSDTTSAIDYKADYSFDGNEKITFKNMTMYSVYCGADGQPVGGVDAEVGFARCNNLVFEDCTINGTLKYNGWESTTFKNVVFNCRGEQWDYSVETKSGKEYTFDGCTFNTPNGKVINVYTGDSSKKVTINYKDCTVNSEKANKSVLNIKDNQQGESWKTGLEFFINISGKNYVYGLAPNKYTCSRLFEVVNVNGVMDTDSGSADFPLVVSIDGTKVWENGKMVAHAIYTTNDVYTDGEKDNAYTWNYSDWEQQADGSYKRTTTQVCDYCGWKHDDSQIGYTVTYVDENGKELQKTTEIKDSDTPLYKGDELSREGYTFIGFGDIDKTVTGNVVYTAQWSHEHTWGDWHTTKEPTCTEDGEESRECKYCGETETRTIPATGHDWDNGTVTKQPTYTEEGVMTYTCKNDPSHTYTEAIPKLVREDDDGHKAEDIWYWVTDIKNETRPTYTVQMQGSTMVITTDIKDAILHVELDGWDDHDDVRYITFVTPEKTTTIDAPTMLSRSTMGELWLTHTGSEATLSINGTDYTYLLAPKSSGVKSLFGSLFGKSKH